MGEDLCYISQQMKFSVFAREYQEELEEQWNTINWNKAKH